MARLDPHSFADADQPVTEHLDLRLRVDFKTSTLHGTAKLHLAQPAAGGPMDLDTRDIHLEDVRDDKGAPVRFELDEAHAFMGSRLRLHLAPGTRSVVLRYKTCPQATALQWLTPEQTAGRKHPFLFSQCQAIHARSMVPLQDTPRVRMRFHAELTVPAGLTAVMAAAHAGQRPGPDAGTTTFMFDMPQPIPSYLLALAVGDLAGRDLSPRARVYAEPQVLEAAAHEFAEVETMIKGAEALFGPYPWERFDLLVMPPSFPYGGMENPRLVFLTPTLLAGDRSLVNVVIHELAHAWTGNLVTNASMEHFWLNEGFTVFAERRILEAREGAQAVALHAAIGRASLEEDLNRLGRTSPHTCLRTHLANVDPDEVYSQVPYEKGCLFLQRMEQETGRAAFDRFLSRYLRRFAFKSITTEDFMTFLEEELPGVMAKVKGQRWIHEPGLPEDAPRARSTRLEQLEALAEKWAAGQRPDVETLKACSVRDWQVLLPRLPRKMNPLDCQWLDEQFGLSRSNNAEVRVGFLTLAARAPYRAVDPVVRETLLSVGRMKYLRPLYTALKENPETLEMARAIFQEAKDGYHPVARMVVEGLLKSAPPPSAPESQPDQVV